MNDPLDVQLDSKHCINVAPRRPLTNHLGVDVIRDLLERKFSRVELPKRFLPVSVRGELGKSNWNSDVSDDTSDVGSSFREAINE